MTVTFEINGIIENKIIVKQISGNTIFENHNLNTEFEFTAASYKFIHVSHIPISH
jgi:hypothetical protein